MTVRAPGRLQDFVKLRPEVEAVLQHVGRETWDLVLVDVRGAWIRHEFATAEAAEEAARGLGVRVHRGWQDPRLARRMNTMDHWASRDGQRRAL